MATPVIMPRQGQSVESCIIGKWHKKQGDSVAVGDLLFTYETDKAIFDEAATVAGILLAVFFEEGDDVPCLTNVCVIGQPGEDVSVYHPDSASNDQESEKSQVLPEETTIPVSIPVQSTDSDKQGISPRARHLAEQHNVDLRRADGTGPAGRIIERDVRQLMEQGRMATGAVGTYPSGLTGTGLGGRVRVEDVASAGAAAAIVGGVEGPVAIQLHESETWTEKHSTIRKVIARQMHHSLSSMAQLTNHMSFDATAILDLRRQLKAAAADGLTGQGYPLVDNVPTIGDLIFYAVSRVLLCHPASNAHYDDEKMTYFRHVHLGVAVDTPRGLMVPTVFYADQLSLSQLSAQVKALAEECRTGTINPDKLKGGTFTVSNLGSFGIESFTPIINPPQTCILGVNTVTTRVREKDGRLQSYPAMTLSLTYDHRAIDGAPASRLLQDLVRTLENFPVLLMQGGLTHV